MPSQNGIMGDDNFGIDLPRTVLKDDLDKEKKMAKFSKTAEYKVLKDHIEGRISFYQSFLPDGRALTEVDAAERANQWVIANAITGEFKAILAAYETAAETVKSV